MATLADLIEDLVTANRILATQGIVDSFGHVSVRHPDNKNRYLLSRARAPERIEASDIQEYELDGTPVDEKKGQTKMVRREAKGPQLMSSIQAGEESDQAGDVFIREVGKVSAPLNKSNLKLIPGNTFDIGIYVKCNGSLIKSTMTNIILIDILTVFLND